MTLQTISLGMGLLLYSVTGYYAKTSLIDVKDTSVIMEILQESKDWANLDRYAADNEKILSQPNNGRRVVFMGNSITEGWSRFDSAYWAHHPDYINRGISGQTTPQMLIRFRPDVLALKPAAVVILAGINDIAENTGPISLENIFGNMVSMATLAKSAGVKVVICSVLPATSFPWRPQINPKEKVGALNQLLQALAAREGFAYVDYFASMQDGQSGLIPALTYDGVHPNLDGYKKMENLLEPVLQKVLH